VLALTGNSASRLEGESSVALALRILGSCQPRLPQYNPASIYGDDPALVNSRVYRCLDVFAHKNSQPVSIRLGVDFAAL
jgi:hypothetical protein